MQVIQDIVSSPGFQMTAGIGVILVLAVVMIMVIRSPEFPLSETQRRMGMRVIGIVAASGVLLLGTGVVLVHGFPSAQTTRPGQPSASAPIGLTPTSWPSPTPSPTPLPILAHSTVEVLTTYCNAINAKKAVVIWNTYTRQMQQTLLANQAQMAQHKEGQAKFVHCQPGELDVHAASGFLLLQTMDGNGHSDGLDRPYQFLLQVEDQRWKIRQINYCMSDGCFGTGSLVP